MSAFGGYSPVSQTIEAAASASLSAYYICYIRGQNQNIAYLSYSNRHADLLFELINRRHEQKSTLVTTNKSFAEWSEVFPNAACVVALIDRLVHNAEIIHIKGDSYRLKEAQERAEQRTKKRKTAARSTP